MWNVSVTSSRSIKPFLNYRFIEHILNGSKKALMPRSNTFAGVTLPVQTRFAFNKVTRRTSSNAVKESAIFKDHIEKEIRLSTLKPLQKIISQIAISKCELSITF